MVHRHPICRLGSLLLFSPIPSFEQTNVVNLLGIGFRERWSLFPFLSICPFIPFLSIYTDVEDLKEQELVSRIMAGLLENYDDLFENEEEDFSSNDLSSITEQVCLTFGLINYLEFKNEQFDHVLLLRPCKF